MLESGDVLETLRDAELCVNVRENIICMCVAEECT